MRASGEALRDEVDPPDGTPHASEILEWFETFAAWVHDCLDEVPWGETFLGQMNITHRAKSLDTIREKLERGRDGSTNLSNIRDLAGVRIVGDFPLIVQSGIGHNVSALLPGVDVKTVDRRDVPIHGYRALHLELTLHGMKCELQIRTRLQAAWATTFESVADAWGRQIRYGGEPDGYGRTFEQRQDAVRSLIRFGERVIPSAEQTRDRLYELQIALGLVPAVSARGVEVAGLRDKVTRWYYRARVKQLVRLRRREDRRTIQQLQDIEAWVVGEEAGPWSSS